MIIVGNHYGLDTFAKGNIDFGLTKKKTKKTKNPPFKNNFKSEGKSGTSSLCINEPSKTE